MPAAGGVSLRRRDRRCWSTTGYIKKHLVLGTFFYSRQQSGHIPLPYFQQALQDRAKKEGKIVPGLQPGTGANGGAVR